MMIAPSFRLLIKSAFRPGEALERLSETHPAPHFVFLHYVIWLALAPPVFIVIGTSYFGWRLGAEQPLYLPTDALALVAVGYFLALLFGLVGTAAIARWMAATYGARDSFGIHLAFIGVTATPLVVASIFHLFPHVFVNMLVLIPALIWSMHLLYRGLPVVLKTGPEQGMLMASALIAWLLVAAVSLLGLTVALWTGGIGPAIGV